MVRSMSVALGPKIRCNMVMIGSVDNGAATLDAGYTQEMLDRLNNSMVLKRRGYPEDIAYGFLFLASPGSKMDYRSSFICRWRRFIQKQNAY